MSFPAKTVSVCIVAVSAMLAAQPASARSASMTSVLTSDSAGKGDVVARNNNFSNRSQKMARGKNGG